MGTTLEEAAAIAAALQVPLALLVSIEPRTAQRRDTSRPVARS